MGYIVPELIQYRRLKTPTNIAMRHRKVVYIRPRPRRLMQRLHKSNRTIAFGSYRGRPLDVTQIVTLYVYRSVYTITAMYGNELHPLINKTYKPMKVVAFGQVWEKTTRLGGVWREMGGLVDTK